MKTREEIREEILIGLENYMTEFSPDNIIFFSPSISTNKYAYTYQDAWESAFNDTTMDPDGINLEFNFVDMLYRGNVRYFNEHGVDQIFTELPKPYVEDAEPIEEPETPEDSSEGDEEFEPVDPETPVDPENNI